LKRPADGRVKRAEDVASDSQFIKQMHESGSKLEVYQIQEHDVKEFERKIKDKHIKAITGTMKIHELTTKHEHSRVDHKT
jgi:exo-beta-1,3-glucanase (GH17 family)